MGRAVALVALAVPRRIPASVRVVSAAPRTMCRSCRTPRLAGAARLRLCRAGVTRGRCTPQAMPAVVLRAALLHPALSTSRARARTPVSLPPALMRNRAAGELASLCTLIPIVRACPSPAIIPVMRLRAVHAPRLCCGSVTAVPVCAALPRLGLPLPLASPRRAVCLRVAAAALRVVRASLVAEAALLRTRRVIASRRRCACDVTLLLPRRGGEATAARCGVGAVAVWWRLCALVALCAGGSLLPHLCTHVRCAV